MPVKNAPVEAASALVEKTSATFVGRWNHLVSTTNWEKGRIIHQWRQALSAAGAPPPSYSDETWSQCVGNVSSQHVGRLRRVHQRFAETREKYRRLYWSHFQAALDWTDAEEWLQAAAKNHWSISQMRGERAEALGLTADTDDADGVNRQLDEDSHSGEGRPNTWDASWEEIHDPAERGRGKPEDDDEHGEGMASADALLEESSYPGDSDAEEREPAAPPVRPFAHLKTLPSDLEAAFESMKLAILRHKLSGWKEISRDDLLESLEALKTLAHAPSAK